MYLHLELYDEKKIFDLIKPFNACLDDLYYVLGFIISQFSRTPLSYYVTSFLALQPDFHFVILAFLAFGIRHCRMLSLIMIAITLRRILGLFQVCWFLANDKFRDSYITFIYLISAAHTALLIEILRNYCSSRFSSLCWPHAAAFPDDISILFCFIL